MIQKNWHLLVRLAVPRRLQQLDKGPGQHSSQWHRRTSCAIRHWLRFASETFSGPSPIHRMILRLQISHFSLSVIRSADLCQGLHNATQKLSLGFYH